MFISSPQDQRSAMAQEPPSPEKPGPLQAALGDRLRAARLEAGMTQEQLAQTVGIHRVYLSEIENGKANVTIGLLESLAEAVGKPLAELFATPPAPPKPKRRSPPKK